MKHVLPLACAVLLVFLAGCATTETAVPPASTATAASAAPAAVAAAQPDDWQYYSTFKTFGLTMTVKPGAAVNGPGHLAVSSSQDLTLLATLADAADASGSSQTLEPVRSGSQWSFDLFFPKSGTYKVSLLGKPASDKGNTYNVLAETTVTATMDIPANWEYRPAWWKQGMSLTSSSPLAVADEAVISLASREPLSYSYSIRNATRGTSAEDVVSFEQEDLTTTITLSFPETGDYELGLWVKPTADKGTDYQRLSTTRFHATVDPASLPVVPANWKVGPAFKKLGVSILAAPGAAVTDTARILFTAAADASLFCNLEKKTGDTTQSVADMVDTTVNGTQHSARVYFPQAGSYTLSLWGSAKGQSHSFLVARVSFEASPPDRSSLLASNWNVNPRFWVYGLSVAAAPPRAVADSLAVSIAVPAGVTLNASLRNTATGDYVSTIATDTIGTSQRISALFPKSGEYELSLAAKGGDDAYGTRVGTATFVSTFDDSVPRYRLWRMNGSWPLLPVTKVEKVSAPWKPRGRWSETEEHSKAVLSADFAFPVGATTVTLRKGTAVEFDASFDGSAVGTFVFTLPKDVTMKMDSTSVVMKAGSVFAMDGYGFGGVASKDMKIAVPGGEVACLKGSRLLVDDGSLSEIELQGKGTYTAAKKVYDCTGSVVVETSSNPDYPSTVHISNAKALPLQFGSTTLTLPEGSAIVFTEKGIDHVAPSQDLVVTVNGRQETVAEGWAARFDEAGAMETYQAE